MSMKYIKDMDVKNLGFKKALRTNLDDTSVRYVFINHKGEAYTLVFNTKDDFESVSEFDISKNYKHVATVNLKKDIPEDTLRTALKIAAQIKDKKDLVKVIDKISSGYWITESIIILENDNEVTSEEILSALKTMGSETKSNIFNVDSAYKWSLFLSLGISMLAIIVLIRFYLKTIYLKHIENKAKTTDEIELEKFLFGKQTGKESDFDIYDRITTYIKNIIHNKNAMGLILTGPPGTGKTYEVRRTLHFEKLSPNDDYVIVKGSGMSLSDLYQLFFDYRKRLIVLDDFDTALKDEDTINILKAATDTYPVRTISMPQSKIIQTGERQQRSATPDKFKFEGKLIIITNKESSEIPKALRSRMPIIEVNFNLEEMDELVTKMIKYMNPLTKPEINMEILSFIKEYRKNHPEQKIDLRDVKNIMDARITQPDNWKEIATSILS